MAINVTYTFANATTADATEVNTNFQDLIDAMTDGTQDFAINDLDVSGDITVDGSATLGNASGDDLTINASLASSVAIKTTYSYSIGSATLGLKDIYMGSDDSAARTVKIVAPTVASSSKTLTLPDRTATVFATNAAYFPNWIVNLGLAAETTTNANDSIRITGATAALSAVNAAMITLPSSDTAGLQVTFSVTADVTIDLTGAHWGLGTLGDFSDVELRVYAINDDGNIKWGVSNMGGYYTITQALTSNTPTDINLQTEMLVSAALSGAGPWPCKEVGWVKANFDDTGGASEDLWAVQTDIGDINVGVPVPTQTGPTTFTPTIGNGGATSSNAGIWWRDGAFLVMTCSTTFTGAGAGAATTYALPTGKLLDYGVTHVWGDGSWYDASATYKSAEITTASATTINFAIDGASVLQGNDLAANDKLRFTVRLPIIGWSGN